VALFLGGLMMATLLRSPPNTGRLAEVSKVVRATNGEILELRLTSSGHWREPARLADIDPNLIEMLVAYEDRRFWSHHGVDLRALLRATASLLTTGRVTSGASTLTMQTARLIDPRLGKRSIYTKAWQILEAIRIDAHWSKEEILEAYFTLAPYGGNIEGVVAASNAWFEKPPKQLTMTESALLVALPQSPESRRPDRHPERAFAAKARVLATIAKRIGLSQQELAEYASEALPLRKYKPTSTAPHLTDRFGPHNFAERSSLDVSWQLITGKIVSDYVEQFPAPINGAAIVIERRTGFVRSYVGSSGYLATDRKGGINYLRAVRSPGSTLKPFIYAKALQLGKIQPNEVFEDAPIQVDGYVPGNFDAEFSGTVTLQQALLRSLNIPAVNTLEAVGTIAFENAVSSFLGRSSPDPAGLSMSVGGYYMTAEELAALYLEFADPGVASGLKFFKNPVSGMSGYLFEKRSARTVQNLLHQTEGRGRAVQFKTGTSHNRQDAWAVALTSDHIVLSWLGTPDVEPTEVLTGRSAAWPMARRIIDALGLKPPVLWDDVLMPNDATTLEATCPKLIQFPSSGEWIKSDTLSISVAGHTSVDWFLNGSRTKVMSNLIKLSKPGLQKLTARLGSCSETVEIFVEFNNTE
jgi:penicillin-binding protein 1C